MSCAPRARKLRAMVATRSIRCEPMTLGVRSSHSSLASSISRWTRFAALRTGSRRFRRWANGEFDAINDRSGGENAGPARPGRAQRMSRKRSTQLQALRQEQGLGGGGCGSPPSSSGVADRHRLRPRPVSRCPATLVLECERIDRIRGICDRSPRARGSWSASYPTDENAPLALVRIGDTYKAERNLIAADSVYQLETERYPKDPATARALYLRGKPLWDANKRTQARRCSSIASLRDYPGLTGSVISWSRKPPDPRRVDYSRNGPSEGDIR